MPAGVLVTVPLPDPVFETDSECVGVTGSVLNVAVTARLSVIETVHEAVLPEQSPLQPAKLDPAAGVAVSVTEVPSV
jgi:hypothetical protein